MEIIEKKQRHPLFGYLCFYIPIDANCTDIYAVRQTLYCAEIPVLNYFLGFLMLACAAASLATGTRNGEHET